MSLFGNTGVGRLLGSTKKKSKSKSGSDKFSQEELSKFMDKGEKKGEQLTGSTLDEVGAGRKDVRSRLQKTLEGDSVGANRLRQSQNDSVKAMKAQQAASGGGSQMNVGQQEAMERQNSRDTAEFVSNEKRQALSDLSKEWRGAGSDISSMTGQFGSILVGMKDPAMPKQQEGLVSSVFGGLF